MSRAASASEASAGHRPALPRPPRDVDVGPEVSPRPPRGREIRLIYRRPCRRPSSASSASRRPSSRTQRSPAVTRHARPRRVKEQSIGVCARPRCSASFASREASRGSRGVSRNQSGRKSKSPVSRFSVLLEPSTTNRPPSKSSRDPPPRPPVPIASIDAAITSVRATPCAPRLDRSTANRSSRKRDKRVGWRLAFDHASCTGRHGVRAGKRARRGRTSIAQRARAPARP